MNNRTLLFSVAMVIAVRAWGAATLSKATETAPLQTPSYKSYSYVGDKFRDPFVSLIGNSRGSADDDRPPQIQSMLLKGIVQDAKGRMALLTNGVSSYILRGGRLYDVRNRQVKKISGVIKAESVVLIGSDRTVRELRINKPVL